VPTNAFSKMKLSPTLREWDAVVVIKAAVDEEAVRVGPEDLDA